MRVDSVLLLAIAAIAGPLVLIEPLAFSIAALLCLCALLRTARPVVLVAATLVIAFAALRGARALDRYEAERIVVRDAIGVPSRCAATASVVASPNWRGDVATYLADLDELECDGRRISGSVRARLYGGTDDLRRGDRLEVVAQLAPVRLFRNPGLMDPGPFAARSGVVLSGMVLGAELVERRAGLAGAIDAARAEVRRRIVATFSPDAVPMARALVLGENDLPPDDDEAFRRSGLSHLLAVSGTHLVFAVLALVQALAFVLARVEVLAARWDVGRIAALVGVPLALGYADFAGGSGSAWRAAWMLAIAFAVRALGRRPVATRAFALSMLVGAVVDPLVAFDISFQLSALATAGLLSIGPALVRVLGSGPSPRGLLERAGRAIGASVAATLAAMIPCTPLLLLMAPELTLAGIAANVIAGPIGETVALPVCLAHTVLGAFPALEQGAALVGSGALLIVRGIAHLSASSRALAFAVPPPSAWQLALLAVCAAGLTNGRLRRVWLGALLAGWLILELAAMRAGRPLGVLRVTAADVEQGDATLIDLPDGSLMLIDAGGYVGSPVDPGRSVILPLLRARRRHHIDVMVLSHPHPDHFGGLTSVLRGVSVGELWDTGQGEKEGAGPVYRGLLREARARGVRIRRPEELCGLRSLGGAQLDVLAPCPTFVPRRDANDNSFVLRLVHGRRAVLLTGDAELEAERELLAHRRSELRADLLKVGHHGSRTSTSPPFLAAVAPALATISCGVRNRYGHPHKETMDTLARAGVVALRLDRTGGVVWTTDGRGVRVTAFSEPR